MADTKPINLERITNVLREHKLELKEKYGIKEIGIFGSYVRKDQKKDSDLDILVEFEKDTKMGLLRFINLQNYISDFLGVKVDLVSKKALKPRIGKHILREVIYL